MRNLIASVLLSLFSASACFASDAFTGQWRLIAGCPDGYGVAVKLIQRGRKVSGEWSDLPFMEGNKLNVNTFGGLSGKIKGKVKGKTAFVKVCNWDEASKCDFENAGILQRTGANLIWVNEAFENEELTPPRGSRLVLIPGSADASTWKCQKHE